MKKITFFVDKKLDNRDKLRIGIKYYLIPDFSQINLTVAGNALGQAFFSLSLGMGMLITYGSYISKDNNIIKSASFIIPSLLIS